MNPCKLLIIAGLTSLCGLNALSALKQLPTHNLLNNDGLLTTTVNDLAQDSRGFIWIATPYGLYRHDGVSVWKYFDNGDTAGISSNLINRVAADTAKGKVWIGTYFSGVCVFDCASETFTRLNCDRNDNGSLSSDIVNDIFIDADGTPWVATDKGVDRYDYNLGRFDRFDPSTITGFPGGGVNRVLVDGDIVWLGHKTQGLSRLTLATGEITTFRSDGSDRSVSSNTILSLCKGSGDTLWIGTPSGATMLDLSTREFRAFGRQAHIDPSFSTQIFDIAHTSDGYLWFGTSSNICYFHESEAKAILEGKSDVSTTYIRDYEWGIANPSVFALLEDRFGNFWAGSNGGGASFFDRGHKIFSSWRINKIPGVNNGLNDKEILAICLSPDEDVTLLGTDGGGININIGGVNGKYLNPDNSALRSNVYNDILRGPDGRYLLSSYWGIDVLDLDRKTVRCIKMPKEGYPASMMIDSQGAI